MSAQLIGVVGLLFVPIGVLWLAYELRTHGRIGRNEPHTDKRSRLAVAALVTGCVVVAILVLAAVVGERLSFGILLLALSLYALSRLIPAVRQMKSTEDERFNAIPVYLIVIPIAVLILQLLLAAPATEFSRNRAIAASALMLAEIEAHRAAHGQYPETMLGINKDYHPSVLGIERYEYARRGNAYNVVFEQPLFVLQEFGARELVVYHPRDEHVILSHAVWNLVWTPEEAARRQGWFAEHETGHQHWKYFWFD